MKKTSWLYSYVFVMALFASCFSFQAVASIGIAPDPVYNDMTFSTKFDDPVKTVSAADAVADLSGATEATAMYARSVVNCSTDTADVYTVPSVTSYLTAPPTKVPIVV